MTLFEPNRDGPPPERPLWTMADIEQIYSCFPLKVGKRTALVAIDKALKRIVKGECQHKNLASKEAVEWLRLRVVQFAKSPKGRRRAPQSDPCPHPTTWFNGDRFDDEQGAWGKDQSRPIGPEATMDWREVQRRIWIRQNPSAKDTFEAMTLEAVEVRCFKLQMYSAIAADPNSHGVSNFYHRAARLAAAHNIPIEPFEELKAKMIELWKKEHQREIDKGRPAAR